MSDPAVVSVVILAFAVLIATFYFGYKFLNTKSSDKKSKKKSDCPDARGVDAWDDDCTYITACDLEYVLSKDKKKCECDPSLGYKDSGKKCECDSTKNLVADEFNNCECDTNGGYVASPGNPYMCVPK